MLSFFKKYIHNIYIFFAYLVLSILYFIYPLTHNLLIADGDGFYSYFPLKMYYAGFLRDGIHLWLPYQFLGESFLGSLQTGLLYPLNFMYLFMPNSLVPHVFNFNLILHYALAGFFMYLFLREIKLKPLASFIGGLIFAFSGFLMAHRGHISVQNAAIWLPLILLYYEKIKTTFEFRYVILAAFAIALQILAGFFQVSLYTYIILFFYTAYYFVQNKLYSDKNWLKYLVFLSLPVVLGVVIALPQLVSTFEMSRYSLRSGINYNFFTEFSMPPITLLSMIIPFMFGGAYGLPHWASYQRAEMGAFIGIAPFLIAMIASIILFRKNKNVPFWIFILGIGMFLSFGRYNPLYQLFYNIPIYNLFRVPARNIFELDFALVTLFSIGINSIILRSKEGSKIINKLIYALIFVVFFIFVLSTIGKTFGYASAPTMSDFLGSNGLTLVGQIFKTKSVVLFIPFLFACFYLLWIMFFKKKIFSETILLTGLILVLFAETYSFGMVYDANWPKISEVKEYFEQDLTKFLTDNAKFERVVFVNQQSPTLLSAVNKINSLNGYDSLLNSDLHQILDITQSGASPSWQDLLNNNLILSSLGVKYIVVPKKLDLDLSQYIGTLNSPPITFEDITLSGPWNYQNAILKNGEYVLQSPDGNILSVMQHRISLKKNTFYQLSVKARKLKEDPSYPLIMGIYGGVSYDNAEQNFNIDNSIFLTSSNIYSKIVNTGDKLPEEDISLRLYSYSRTPILIDSVSIKEVKNYHVPIISTNSSDETTLQKPLYKEIFKDDENLVYENINNLSRVYFINKLELSSNILDTKSKYYSLSINPQTTAFVSESDLKTFENTKFNKGTVKINKYDTDRINVTAKIDKGEGFLVFADQYFPGWKAFIDGRQVKIYKTNNLIRGIIVPKGTHEIRMEYLPLSLYLSLGLSLSVLIILLIVLKKNKFK